MKSPTIVLAFALLAGSLGFAAEPKASPKIASVIVDFVVGSDGRPTQVTIVDATDKKYADAVVAAVLKWRFDKRLSGKRVRQPVEFQLGDDAPKQNKANQTTQPSQAPGPRG